MEQTQSNTDDWREDLSDSSKPTLKVADGENAQFTFTDQGKKRHHPDFGDSVVFIVNQQGEEKNFYVNAQNYDLLGQIKALGSLPGTIVKLSRTGSKKSDTRYTITKL